MRHPIIAALLGALVLLGACGEDDVDNGAEEATTEEATTEEATTEEATEEQGDDGGDEAAARVTITSPSEGATVSNPVVIEPDVVNAEIAPAAESGEGQGHYHVLIDSECVPAGQVIPRDDTHVHFGDGSTTLELPELEPGEHTLCVQLGDAQHQAFGNPATITIEVEG